MSARSQGVRRALEGPGVPWWTQKGLVWQWLGPGNTNPRVGWVGRGSTHPAGIPSLGTHPAAPPRVHPPPASMKGTPASGTTGTCTYDRFRRPEGDPRGVIRTVLLRCSRGGLTQGPAVSLSPPVGPCCRYPLRSPPQYPYSQYISVFLSISQYVALNLDLS